MESDGVITISEAGSYTLTGNYRGQIRIDAGKDDKVELVLDGFHITNETSAPIYGIQCGTLTIYLKEGTENSVEDGEEYAFAAEGEDEPDSPIFSKDDMVITGQGTLLVNGSYRHGIHSKDNLTILSGTIRVTSAEDAIKGKDSVTVEGGIIEAVSGEDGIKSNNDKDEGKGNVTIEGGDITVRAGDDGIHAESSLIINGGNINIAESYEGLEGMRVEINGGTIQIASSDDGINAAGGVYATEEEKERASRQNNENMYVRITGGQVTVDASADGIDSNGSVYVEGGTIVIHGPETEHEAALDYNGEAQISGGTFAALGSGSMMQYFSENSAANSIMIYCDGEREAGTEITLSDQNGGEIIRIISKKRFSSILMSAQELAKGETYTLTVGDETKEIELTSTVTVEGEHTSRGMGGRGGDMQKPESGSGRPEDGPVGGRGQGRGVPDRAGAKRGGPENETDPE